MYSTRDYHHIDVRDKDLFETIRTPEWARHAGTVIAEEILGFDLSIPVEIRTGRLKTGGWAIHSVLIPNRYGIDLNEARDIAMEIVDDIEHRHQ